MRRMTMRFCAFALVFLASAFSFATSTISGNLADLSGTAVTSRTFLRALVRGCSGNQPRVNGTGLIVPSYYDFTPSASGVISGTLYRNDTEIECGGSLGVTWYGMVLYRDGKPGPEVPYSVAAASFNINSATPNTTSPVVSAPTGDTTYARLDGGNTPFTGTVTGPTFYSSTAPVYHVRARGAACDGIVDDTTIINSSITAANTAGGGIVELPSGTCISSQVVMKSNVWFRGAGRHQTTLKLKASSNQSLVVLSAATTQDTLLSDMTIEGNATNQSAGNWHGIFYDNTGQVTLRRNLLARIIATHCKGDGVHFEAGFSGEGPQVDIISYYNDRYGIYVGIPDLFFTNIDVGQSGLQGIYIATGNVHFTASKSWYSGRLDTANGEGFYSTGSRTQLTGVEAQDNAGAGFSFLNTTDVTAAGLVADSNGTGSTAAGIKLNTVTNSTFSGSTFDRNGSPVQAYGIQFAGTNTSNTVILSSKNQLTSDTNGTIGVSNAVAINGKWNVLYAGTTPASGASGPINIPNNSGIYGRNAANSNDIQVAAIRSDDGAALGPNYVCAYSTSVTPCSTLTRSSGKSDTRWTTFWGQAVDLSETATPSAASATGQFWFDSSDHFARYNPNNAGAQQVGQSAFVTSVYTNATTTFSDLTGMSWSIAASRNYTLTCQITWQGSANTAGPKFQLTGPGSPTAVTLNLTSAVTATTSIYASAVAFSSAVANTGTVTATTNFPAILTGGIVNGVNAGTLKVQAAANGVGTLTIQPGSYCVIQ